MLFSLLRAAEEGGCAKLSLDNSLYFRMYKPSGQKRRDLDHIYAAVDSPQGVDRLKVTQLQGGSGDIGVGSGRREAPSQVVGKEMDWAGMADTPDVDVNNVGSRKKRKKMGGTTGDQDNSGTGKDPLAIALEAAGVEEDMVVGGSNSADVEEADGTVVENNTTGIGRVLVAFPETCTLSLENKYTWYMALLKQHPECKPLFKEGRNAPYITLNPGQQYDRLTTEDFQGQVMKPITGLPRTVVIFDVPTYINVSLLQCPPGFVWIRRRMAGKSPRPQLLGAVLGSLDAEVHILGVGRKKVAPFVPEPYLCERCSNWGHKGWRCRATYYRCRYCAGGHPSKECLGKIQRNVAVPPKCCNCGGQHNASSPVCPRKPHYSKTQPPSSSRVPTTVLQPAPSPTRPAWNITAMQGEFPSLNQEKTTSDSSAAKVGSLSIPQLNDKVNAVATAQERLGLAMDKLTAVLNESLEEIRADRMRLESRMQEYIDAKFKEVQEIVRQDIQTINHEVQETVHQEIKMANCQQAKVLESIMERVENLEKPDKERQENYEQLTRNIELILEKFEAFRREVRARLNDNPWPPSN